jgi:elongation factor P
VKGDTSGKSFKPATLDTGIEVNVPLFCDIGTKIMIDTRDGSFAERVK